MRPAHRNGIWSVDFLHDKLSNGRSYKMLTVLDEYTRPALCVTVRTRMVSADVLEALYPLLLKHGKPEYICSDNGPEFVAAPLQEWLTRVGIKPIQIHPSSPWENTVTTSASTGRSARRCSMSSGLSQQNRRSSSSINGSGSTITSGHIRHMV
jgi:transposase InsO family protein